MSKLFLEFCDFFSILCGILIKLFIQLEFVNIFTFLFLVTNRRTEVLRAIGLDKEKMKFHD